MLTPRKAWLACLFGLIALPLFAQDKVTVVVVQPRGVLSNLNPHLVQLFELELGKLSNLELVHSEEVPQFVVEVRGDEWLDFSQRRPLSVGFKSLYVSAVVKDLRTGHVVLKRTETVTSSPVTQLVTLKRPAQQAVSNMVRHFKKKLHWK